MKSIRNFAYAALLAVSALSLSPSTASAQSEGGTFTLAHDVRWQNVIVPAGEYRFSLQPSGPSQLLRLTRMTGAPASFMLLVTDMEETTGTEKARLTINSAAGTRYVSAMDLPEFQIVLHFAPPAGAGKEVAMVRTSAAASAR
jgi:hypothetical protein